MGKDCGLLAYSFRTAFSHVCAKMQPKGRGILKSSRPPLTAHFPSPGSFIWGGSSKRSFRIIHVHAAALVGSAGLWVVLHTVPRKVG